MGGRCEVEGCSKRPSFGDSAKKYRWCAEHRAASAVTAAPQCEAAGCDKHAWGPGKKRWCAAHRPGAKDKSMEKRSGIQCEAEGCNKRPSFGNAAKKYRWCAEHKPTDAVSAAPMCVTEGCDKHASFGLMSDKKKRWCAKHRCSGAVSKCTVKCKAKDCRKEAAFGLPKGTRQWCSEHKGDKAVNLTKLQCAWGDCKLKASMVSPTSNSLLCVDHASGDCQPLRIKKRVLAREADSDSDDIPHKIKAGQSAHDGDTPQKERNLEAAGPENKTVAEIEQKIEELQANAMALLEGLDQSKLQGLNKRHRAAIEAIAHSQSNSH